MNGQRSDIPERLDCGYMTRSKTRELGLDKEFLTTSMGCRKRDAINVRKTRKKQQEWFIATVHAVYLWDIVKLYMQKPFSWFSSLTSLDVHLLLMC